MKMFAQLNKKKKEFIVLSLWSNQHIKNKLVYWPNLKIISFIFILYTLLKTNNGDLLCIIRDIDLKLNYFEWNPMNNIGDVIRNELIALKQNDHFQKLNLNLLAAGNDNDDEKKVYFKKFCISIEGCLWDSC